MIGRGRSRTDGRELASYLLDRDGVEVWQVRGTFADELYGALMEMEDSAIGTRCEKPLYHFFVRPETDANLTRKQWLDAVDRYEDALGLSGYQRAIVYHPSADEDAEGAHLHVVWNRIHPETMKAINLGNDDYINKRVSRALEIDLGLKRLESEPLARTAEGMERERAPKLWEIQQGVRTGIDPRDFKPFVDDLVQRCDSGAAAKAALEDERIVLSQGKRGYVLVDEAGGVHSLARCVTGMKKADVDAFMADVPLASLPNVEEAKALQAARREQSLARGEDEGRSGREGGEAASYDRDRQNQAWEEKLIDAAIAHDRQQETARSDRERTEGQEERAAEAITERNPRFSQYRNDRLAAHYAQIDLARSQGTDDVQQALAQRHLALALDGEKIYVCSARYKFEPDDLMQAKLQDLLGERAALLPGIKEAKQAAWIEEKRSPEQRQERAEHAERAHALTRYLGEAELSGASVAQIMETQRLAVAYDTNKDQSYVVTEKHRFKITAAQTARMLDAINAEHPATLAGEPALTQKAMLDVRGAHRAAWVLQRDHEMRGHVMEALEAVKLSRGGGEAFAYRLAGHDLDLVRDYGNRLYLDTGKRKVALHEVLPIAENAQHLQFTPEQFNGLEKFRSRADSADARDLNFAKLDEAREARKAAYTMARIEDAPKQAIGRGLLAADRAASLAERGMGMAGSAARVLAGIVMGIFGDFGNYTKPVRPVLPDVGEPERTTMAGFALEKERERERGRDR